MLTIPQPAAGVIIIPISTFSFTSCDTSSMHDMPATSTPPGNARQFDFRLGEWDLTWADGGQGKNVITLFLDSSVVHESFNGQPSIQLVGRSVSVFVPRENLWKQTWGDNQGGYLDFTGGMSADRMLLSRAAVDPQGQPIL